MWQQFDDDDEEYFFALDIAIGNGITMNHRGVWSVLYMPYYVTVQSEYQDVVMLATETIVSLLLPMVNTFRDSVYFGG